MAKKVFALSTREKDALKRNPATNRGYDALGGQSLDGAVAFNRDVEGKTLANLREDAADLDLKGPFTFLFLLLPCWGCAYFPQEQAVADPFAQRAT